MNPEQLPLDEKFLREQLEKDPSDWEARRRLAHALYDNNEFHQASDVIWAADHIPSNDIDLAYAARILAKAQPRKAIRLLAAVLELNRGKAVQNMGMANALLHHGMALQAARFYGAALEADPTLVNPELEHFILWIDDEMSLWADFTERRPKLGELPWMARDPMEALHLTTRVGYHTTPISIPCLPAVPGEDILNDLYEQEMKKKGKITPPPAVTIPIDRVDPKDRRFDDRYGATSVGSDEPSEAVAADNPDVPMAQRVLPAIPAAAAAPVPSVVGAQPALPSAPVSAPMPAPMVIPVPMAIPLPDHVVAVAPPVASVVPTVPISPPPPSRSPSSLPGQLETTPAPKLAPTPSPSPTQPASPTRRLLTPGGKPVVPQAPTPSSQKPPKAG